METLHFLKLVLDIYAGVKIKKPSRFGSVVAHLDLDGEVPGSSPGHTKDFKNGTHCSSACACNNELE